MRFLYILLIFLFTVNSFALDKLRVGVLAYGTVNWELRIMQLNDIAKKNGLELEIKKLPSKNGVNIALQAGAVDVIVSDYIWVSRQRSIGADFTFYPYSKAVGGIYVRPELEINDLLGLYNKKLGISGGPVNQTWLITRAYTKYKYGKDLKEYAIPIFTSPPILNKKVLDKSLDGAINFWHYNAKLEAKGMKRLISLESMLNEMGIKDEVPFIGWVFSEKFAKENKKLINSFLQASYETKKLLDDSSIQWLRIKKQMKTKNEKTYNALVKGYRDGIPKVFGKNERLAAKKVFNILVKEGGRKLVGKSKTLEEGTFWNFNPKIEW